MCISAPGLGPPDGSRESGWLLWVRGGTLVAQRLDVEQAALTGDPVTLAEGVAVDDFLRSGVSVASTGLVAYRTGATTQRQLTWVDRSGSARGTVGNADSNNLRNPRVSPDGKRVAVNRTVQGNTDIWLLDGARMSRLTSGAAFDQSHLWSPDGARIVFETNRTGPFDLYQTSTGGAGVEELVVASDENKVPSSWSADGRFLMYMSAGPSTRGDLWVVPMTGDSDAVGVPEDAVQRGVGRVLAGWPVGGLPIERIGADRNLRAAVCPALAADAVRGPRTDRGPVEGVHGGRRLPRLAARRQRTVLPQPGGHDDGGDDHRHRVHARTGRAGGALSHTHPRRRGGFRDSVGRTTLPLTGVFSSTLCWTSRRRRSRC